MTGTDAREHGVLDNSGYALAPSVATIAEIAKANGYATGGAVSSVVLDGRSGIARGFDLWDDDLGDPAPGEPTTQVERKGAATERALSRWIAGHGSAPFLAFLHVFEPHSPYAPPEPFRSRWTDPYDGEIAAADAAVGSFVAGLKAAGLYDGSLVVFLSDHGEGLGDHGEKEHGVFLYRESIRVPVVVKLPGSLFGGTTVGTPVGLTDVFRTVCEALELEGCPDRPGLVSLVELARGREGPRRRILSETFYPRTRFGWSPLASLADERWHFVDAPRPELYDLLDDPSERMNRAAGKAGPIRSMRAELETRRSSFRQPSPIDAEKARQLASLGYVTVRSGVRDDALPDPKDRIATLAPLRDGMAALRAGRPAEAVRVLAPFLDRNPRVRDAWEVYAQALLGEGRNSEALEAAERMLPLSAPGASEVLLSVASVALSAGRPEAALRHAAAARALGDPAADDVLARAHLAAGDLDGAEEAAAQVLARGRSPARALLVLARVATLRGDLPGALKLADRARDVSEEEARKLAGLYFVRGDVLARLGRAGEAEEELLTEIGLFPVRVEARAALVALRAATGRREGALAAAREIAANVPGPGGIAAAIRSLEAIGERAAARELRAGAARRLREEPVLRGKGEAGLAGE